MIKMTRFVGAVTLAGLIATLAACSGADSGGVATARRTGAALTTPGADPVVMAQKYLTCMRRSGVVMLDQLTPEGLPQIDKNKSAVEAVTRGLSSCRSLLPVATRSGGPAAADVEKLRAYAICLRAHGVPEYPDPDPATGAVQMDDALSAEVKGDPDLSRAMSACLTAGAGSGDTGVVGG